MSPSPLHTASIYPSVHFWLQAFLGSIFFFCSFAPSICSPTLPATSFHALHLFLRLHIQQDRLSPFFLSFFLLTHHQSSSFSLSLPHTPSLLSLLLLYLSVSSPKIRDVRFFPYCVNTRCILGQYRFFSISPIPARIRPHHGQIRQSPIGGKHRAIITLECWSFFSFCPLSIPHSHPSKSRPLSHEIQEFSQSGSQVSASGIPEPERVILVHFGLHSKI